MELKNSICGRQSLRNRFNTINNSLKDMGFTPTTSDRCVYTFGTSETFSILTLYVDNLLLLGGNASALQELKRELMNRFTMTDMGGVSLVLGVQITRDREAGTLTISQEHYTAVLARFGMVGCNPVHTMGAGTELSTDQPDDLLLGFTGTEHDQYITGSLMFLSQCTRYDITYSVNQLPRAMSKPYKLHITAAKHLLRYLEGSMSLALTYRTGCFKMEGFCDASWGNNPDNGKSTSGYLFMMAGGPLSFKGALQSVTAQSTKKQNLSLWPSRAKRQSISRT